MAMWPTAYQKLAPVATTAVQTRIRTQSRRGFRRLPAPRRGMRSLKVTFIPAGGQECKFPL